MGTLMPSTQSAPFSLVEKNDRIVCASARIIITIMLVCLRVLRCTQNSSHRSTKAR